MDINKRRGGFTLAEVLITLSIIGVVAALTIPSLVVKNQEKQTVVQLKKAYNVFSNAFSLAKLEYGEISTWGWGSEGSLEGGANAMDKISPYLNLMKRCDGTKGCFPKDITYKYLNGSNWVIPDNGAIFAKGIFADGNSFLIWSKGYNPSYPNGFYGIIIIDVNGAKNPNTIGKDCFEFIVTSDGIIPGGTTLNDPLINPSTSTLENNCKDDSGKGCTIWALVKENLDYPPKGQGFN